MEYAHAQLPEPRQSSIQGSCALYLEDAITNPGTFDCGHVFC